MTDECQEPSAPTYCQMCSVNHKTEIARIKTAYIGMLAAADQRLLLEKLESAKVLQRLTDENEALDARLVAARAMRENIRANHHESKLEVKRLTTMIDEARTDVADLEHLKALCAAYKKENTRLREREQDQAAEIDGLKNYNEELNRHLGMALADVKMLGKDNDGLNEERAVLQQKYNKARNEVHDIDTTLAALHEENQKLKDERDSLVFDRERWKANYETAQGYIDELKARSAKHVDNLFKAENKAEALEAELENVRTRDMRIDDLWVNITKADHTHLRSTIDSYSSTIDAQRNDLARKDKEIDRLKAELGIKTKQVNSGRCFDIPTVKPARVTIRAEGNVVVETEQDH